MDQKRIIELEIKIAYQELAIESLQQNVFEYHSAITALEKSVKALTEKLNGLIEPNSAPPPHQKPPHY